MSIADFPHLLGLERAIYAPFTCEIWAMNMPLGLLEELYVHSFFRRLSSEEQVNSFIECMESMSIMDADNADSMVRRVFCLL